MEQTDSADTISVKEISGGMKVTLLLNCTSGNQVETLIGFLGFRS